MRLLLLNPNTTAATTAMMLAIARETLGPAAALEGMTAQTGAPVILDEPALAGAAAEVARMTAARDRAVDGILIAAFGDPGLDAARARLRIPVAGLAEAAIAEAARDDRTFAIVTTTPALDRAIRARVTAYGAAAGFTGLRYTRSGSDAMTDPARLHDELLEACTEAVQDGAAAIVIGGGPLAAAARALRQLVAAALIEPVPAAARALLARVQNKEIPWPTP